MTQHFAGGRIYTLRRSRGLTQEEMAQRLGISPSYLSQLENNQRPVTVGVLMSFASAFDVSPGYFAQADEQRTIAALRQHFPHTPEEQLADFLARYPDMARSLLTPEPTTSPHRISQDFFYHRGNYIDVLDRAGEELAASFGPRELRVITMAERLDKDLGINVRFRSPIDGPRSHFDEDARELSLRTGMREAQLIFDMAQHYASYEYADVISTLAGEVEDSAARALVERGLAQYFAAAVLFPYAEFYQRAEEYRYDIERLAYHYSSSFESTAQRLSTLQRPGMRGVPFAFFRTNRAGTISKRASATSFHLTEERFSCAHWVLHRAFEVPSRVTRQIARMADGATYLWIARYITTPSRGFHTPSREFAFTLGCTVEQAHRVVYSDGLDLSGHTAVEIGPGCPQCSTVEH